MKKEVYSLLILSWCLFVISGLSWGQELTNEIAVSIKYTNIDRLEKLIADTSIDACLGVTGGKKYNYLAMSIKLKSMKSLKFFVERGADIENVCADKTPLMYAAKYGELEMAKYLIEKGADIEVSYKGSTALNYARRHHHRNIVKYLKSLRIK